MDGLIKYGIYMQWNFTQLKRRMKFCHLQVNEWHWKTSSYVKLKRFRRQKATYSFSYVEHGPKMNTNMSNIMKNMSY
jgi:hypothetical protein